MSSHERTLLERAINPTRDNGDEDAESEQIADTDSIAARSTSIGGEEYDLGDSITGPTFDDSSQGMIDGSHGRPRPREFWTAKQLGQTPAMQVVKNIITRQLTGGNIEVVNPDGEIQGAEADVADLIKDIYQGPHYQDMTFDHLLTASISDLIDYGFAYWEVLPTANGEFPVAAFKPLPPLQMQHTINEETGDLGENPAFWRVPYKSGGGSISTMGDPDALERDRVVVMRTQHSARSDSLYGESVATKVREWLELIVDVDVHQKRHYDDSELPSGFLHFAGNIGDDKLEAVENEIVEASGDPHSLVTTSSDGDASWIPVGESVVDLDAIQQQQWYYKLVLAAVGLNQSELNMVESSGFAKEVPALQRMIFKNATKPMMGTILDPQNARNGPVRRIIGEFDTSIDSRLQVDLERFDPVQEQVERQETLDEWREGAVSLNELRGELGRDASEFEVEVPELGGEVNVADLPKYLVDLILDSSPEVNFEDSGGSAGEAGSGPPDFDKDPILSEEEAFAKHGEPYSEHAVKQLEDTIDVQSSFIETVAYERTTEFLQIEFEKSGQNAIYWYASVPEWRFFNFLRATSLGSYFNKYIRHTGDPGYTYARVQ
jgi:hypothetical protein